MEPSLSLFDMTADIRIEHSILGPIQVIREDLLLGPLTMHISDSILDANGADLEAVGAAGRPVAPVELTVRRCTVFGQVHAHSIELAENSIFSGRVLVARRQTGCMRFCYVAPQSRTPKRYQCQPELVEKVIEEKAWREHLSKEDRKDLLRRERLRVEPDFMSRQYGRPDYSRLSRDCATEIRSGAEDRSELGVFHDLYEPQKETNLRAKLADYTPAGMDAGIIFAT